MSKNKACGACKWFVQDTRYAEFSNGGFPGACTWAHRNMPFWAVESVRPQQSIRSTDGEECVTFAPFEPHDGQSAIQNPQSAMSDPGPRMVPVCMIPLSTHRKRLEELAVTARRAVGHVAALNTNERTHETEAWLDDALARLLKELK